MTIPIIIFVGELKTVGTGCSSKAVEVKKGEDCWTFYVLGAVSRDIRVQYGS